MNWVQIQTMTPLRHIEKEKVVHWKSLCLAWLAEYVKIPSWAFSPIDCPNICHRIKQDRVKRSASDKDG
jgi:hypothetical protein